MDALLKYNRNIQEKIAENMLSMTSSMKEHALAANAIIKKDIGLLERSDKLTDVNTTKLKSESLKLQEHTTSYWRCWMWVMIAFVLVVFFSKYYYKKRPSFEHITFMIINFITSPSISNIFTFNFFNIFHVQNYLYVLFYRYGVIYESCQKMNLDFIVRLYIYTYVL